MNKFNIKKLIKVSAVALAMISAGGVASAVNANTNVHADSIAQEQVAEFAKQDQQEANRNEAYSRAMNIQKARQYPQFRLTMEQVSANADPTDTDPGSRLTKSDLARIYAPGYKKGNSNEQRKEFRAIKEFRGVKEARHLLYRSYSSSASTKVAKHSITKKNHRTVNNKGHHNKRARKPRKKITKHFYKKHISKRANRRAKLSKKQFNKLNKQLKTDNKALRSRRARHSYKYRKALNKAIKQLQKKIKIAK